MQEIWMATAALMMVVLAGPARAEEPRGVRTFL